MQVCCPSGEEERKFCNRLCLCHVSLHNTHVRPYIIAMIAVVLERALPGLPNTIYLIQFEHAVEKIACLSNHSECSHRRKTDQF